MYEVQVRAEFCAAHALTINGQREAVHGHNWRTTVTVAGERVDSDGLLVDFHALEAIVAEVLGPFKNADLHSQPPFDRENPSAERLARYIAESVQLRLARLLGRPTAAEGRTPPQCRVVSVHLTEAPGCSVVYRP